MTSERRSRQVLWIVLGVMILGALVVFGRPFLVPTDPDDAAMKVRRPAPAVRRAPGQIGMDGSIDPNAGGDDAADTADDGSVGSDGDDGSDSDDDPTG